MIRCEMRRAFDTSDFNDYDFLSNGDAETFDIGVGKATLLMN